MIDTVKVKIKVSEEDYYKLVNSSNRVETYKGDTKISIRRDMGLTINIGSWDRHIRVLYPPVATDYIFIQLNVSKVYYGHNFFRVNMSQTEEVLSSLNYYFKYLYDVDLGNYLTWDLVRVDPSFSYRFNQDSNLSIIQNIHTLNPVDLERTTYPKGAEFKNKCKSKKIIFYDKHDEFVHGYGKEFSKYYINGAVKRGDLLKEYSKGILIFELQLTERGFFQFFGVSHLSVGEFLQITDIPKRLLKELKKLILNTFQMKLSEVVQLINQHNVSNEVRLNLYKDFLFMTDTSPAGRRLWKSQSRQYRSQVKARLKKVGIPQDVKNDETLVDLLSLESPYYLGSPTREEADKIMQQAVYPTVKPIF